jgi:hypothetical protein
LFAEKRGEKSGHAAGIAHGAALVKANARLDFGARRG